MKVHNNQITVVRVSIDTHRIEKKKNKTKLVDRIKKRRRKRMKKRGRSQCNMVGINILSWGFLKIYGGEQICFTLTSEIFFPLSS